MKISQFLFLFTLLILSQFTSAQSETDCASFAKTGLELLNAEEFIHDGHYHSMTLKEGDQMVVIKPFYKTKKYQIVVFAKENLPGINIIIQNNKNDVLYKSTDNKNTQIYTFIPQKNENMSIIINVTIGENPNPNNTGCVSILVGYSINSY